MKLTNQDIQDAVNALDVFNPPVGFKCNQRLNRNLRKLRAAWNDKEHDRIRLAYSVMTERGKKVEAGQIQLTPEEHEALQPLYRKLMAEVVDVEIHPVEIYDSSEDMKPNDPDHAIDRSKIPIGKDVESRLIDVVLFAPGEFDRINRS